MDHAFGVKSKNALLCVNFVSSNLTELTFKFQEGFLCVCVCVFFLASL